jgi:hypothetical protein
MGNGYVETDISVPLGSVNLPVDSVIKAIAIAYTWGPWPVLNDKSPYVVKKAWKEHSEIGWQPTGETDEPHIATDFQPASQYEVDHILIDGVPRPFSPQTKPSGSINLSAEGFEKYTARNSSFGLRAHMRVGLTPGRVFVHTGSTHHLHYKVSVSLPNTLYATLTVWYLPSQSQPMFSIGGNAGGPGVKVIAKDRSVVSAEDGTYTISNLSAGTYTVTASKPSCNLSPTSLSVSVGPSATGKNFTTSCSFSVSGNVGKREVTVSNGNGRSTVSDSQGNYVLANLPPGTYMLTASKSDCTVSPPALSVNVGPNQTGKDFTTTCGRRSWQISNPNLPAGIYITGGWARNPEDVYIIGTRTAPKGSLHEAFLYHWNGRVWLDAFYLGNASATSVYGTGTSEVWLSAYYAPSGPSAVYHSPDHGISWKPQSLPSQIGNGWVGSLTGTINNIQASGGSDTIIRYDGRIWRAMSAGGITNNDPPGPITVLSPNEGYYTTCWGWGMYNGSSWTFHRGFDFCDVNSIFGMRDPATNRLLLLTAGNQNFSNGIRAWQLNGTSGFGSKCGTVLADPTSGGFICGGIFAGNGSYGYATGIFGSAPTDVYVTGKLGFPTAAGKIYHFDGVTWKNITGTLNALVGGTLPVTTTIFGTAAGDLWIPLADGRVLLYTR